VEGRGAALRLIQKIVEENVPVTLAIQQQMADEHKRLEETDAGIELHTRIMREREEAEDDLANVQQQIEEALEAQDTVLAENSRALQSKYRHRIRMLDESRKKLTMDMEELLKQKYKRIEAEFQSEGRLDPKLQHIAQNDIPKMAEHRHPNAEDEQRTKNITEKSSHSSASKTLPSHMKHEIKPTQHEQEISQKGRTSRERPEVTKPVYGTSGATESRPIRKVQEETVYSEIENLQQPQLLDFATGFADMLYESLPSGLSDKGEFQRVSSVLDELLLIFAQKICCNVNTAKHRRIKDLVYQNRSQVIQNLRHRYDQAVSAQLPALDLTRHAKMTIEEKMSLAGIRDNDKDDSNVPVSVPDGEFNAIPGNATDEDFRAHDDFETYRIIIEEASAYQWLLWQIQAANRLECPGPVHAQKVIRDHILQNISMPTPLSRHPFPHVDVTYRFRLDLAELHTEHQYSCTLEQVLERAITITGHGNNVQAATCLEYVDQTWGPIGVQILRILQQAVFDSRSSNHKAWIEKLTSEASISVKYSSGSEFVVLATGFPYSVVEVGELLAWFGAALRSSPLVGKAGVCVPTISLVSKRQTGHHDLVPIPDLIINFDTWRVRQLKRNGPNGLPGSCWLDAFRNPVIVEGYPILRRSVAGSGLEVSLDIMASLVNAKYHVEFCRRTFLKGFSTMLAVTKIIGSTVFWHLFYNTDRKYISYEDARVPRIEEDEDAQTVDQATLASGRHILGWCDRVSCLAGTRDIDYNIGWSKLRRPHSAFAFDKVSITAGKFVNVSTSMAIGIKDKPEHVSYDDDYLSTLQMISERHFVFYDIVDRHAWLLDGASALLHLLRAFFFHSQTKSLLKDFFIFDEDELQNNDSRQGRDAAFYVLAKEENQLLPLWRKAGSQTEETTMTSSSGPNEEIKYQKGYFCLKDRVLQICRVLQQITAHQDDVYSRDGVGGRIKSTPRRQLEGFDFMDVATNQGTLWPRVSNIHTFGEGWVDFTRELHCVTLFGTGFGMLMKPTGDSCNTCMSNISPGPDLLAITVADLLGIIEKKGDDTRSLWRIVEDIYWYVPDKLFEPCQCHSTRIKEHNRVQIFLPASFPKLWVRGHRTPQVAAEGAILVGHSFKYPLRWGSRNDPEEGEPEIPTDTVDSGIGSSNASESSRVVGHLRAPTSSRGTPSSDSGIYLHRNEQFKSFGDDYPESSLKGKARERIPANDTEDTSSHQSDDRGQRSSRPKGKWSKIWSLGSK
jgi:hypothetical protein